MLGKTKKQRRKDSGMGKVIRILIAILVVVSVVLLGRESAARAANPGTAPGSGAERSLAADDTPPCNDDEKDESEDCEDDEGGTVKPPRHRIKACKVGSYSVGGVATIQIKQLGSKDCVIAFTEAYNSSSYPPLPSGSNALSDVLSLKLPRKEALVKLCFAAPPGGKNVSIYSVSRGAWVAVSTGIKSGAACTETSRSGTFVLLRT
jgi:hypothetical protein